MLPRNIFRFWLVAFTILLSGVGFGQENSVLTGTWKSGQFGDPLVMQFNADGTGTFDETNLQYRVDGKQLIIRIQKVETIYMFVVSENQLVLSGGDLERPMTFVRNPEDDDARSFRAISDALIGLWTGAGDMIEFRADGKCRYGQNLYTYSLSAGHIVLETLTGNIVFEYSMKEGQLILTANGQRSVFTRPAGSEVDVSTRNEVRNPADLVGQWCYLTTTTTANANRCIILHADGTYLYKRENLRGIAPEELSGGNAVQGTDSGTWYVRGGRLYYQSQLRGSGSYRLERRNHPTSPNSPMIALDNELFVTMENRPPWR